MRGSLSWGVVALGGLVACSTSSGSGGSSAAGPCDPLAPPQTTLQNVIGVGEDSSSTFYVADQTTSGAAGEQRVFVSRAGALVRQLVDGSGQQGAPPNASYAFTFRDFGASMSSERDLSIVVQSGVVTQMALGPLAGKGFYSPDAGDQALTVVDASRVEGMPVHDLPGVVGFVADVSDGSVLVLTEPAQPWGTSAFRLFYGAPAQMIERSITAYNQGGSGGLEITFTVGGATDTINFDAAPPADGGLGDTESTGTLDTGSGGPKTVTMRIPTPSTLAGFTFTCTGA